MNVGQRFNYQFERTQSISLPGFPGVWPYVNHLLFHHPIEITKEEYCMRKAIWKASHLGQKQWEMPNSPTQDSRAE
jgi:hypothetical protein